MSLSWLVFLLFALTGAGIVLSLPSVGIPDGIDKVSHALLFFVYMIVILLLYARILKRPPSLLFVFWLVLLLSLAGAGYEYYQAEFMPTRNGDVADWLADVAGILLGVIWYVRSDFAKHRA